MAAAEQPLKKRKLYEPPPPSSPPPPPPPQPQTPPPSSEEEINTKRRNQEEIRNVFECYKRIRFYIEQKNNKHHFLHELNEAYLSLITASRGSASVQRLVAQFIPRYASYCPTALESAVKAVINIYDRCFSAIIRGEDVDGVAFESAKACILGLVDICWAASSEPETSAVTQRICSAVFLSVFNFFVSLLDGKDIFQIVDERILKIHKVAESFSEFQCDFVLEDNPLSIKLLKICALSFLKIFFSCPKNSIVACFELLESSGTEGPRKGKYILHQLTFELNDDVVHQWDEECDGDKLSNVASIDSTTTKRDGRHLADNCSASSGNSFSNCKRPMVKRCLLGLIFGEDLSLKGRMFSMYRNLWNSASSEIVSDVTACLEGVFESFMQQVKADSSQVDGLEGISGLSKHGSQYSVFNISGQQGSPPLVSGIHLKLSSPTETDHIDGGESKNMDLDHADPGDLSIGKNLTPRELFGRQAFSPKSRTPRELRSSSFNGRDRTAPIDKSPIYLADQPSPALRFSSGDANSRFESPKQNMLSHSPSTNQAAWYADGDPASMDIFLASKQIWLGSLGPDASEMLIRFQFDKFGSVEEFRHFPMRGFATIEYRNIMDALKAREVMRGRSPWGACLQVKFLDMALGTRGAINGIAVGSSCYVYVGNVSSKWVKDEMINEVKKVLHKGPRMVSDLNGEGALLIELDSPEEATITIARLRRHRMETGNSYPPQSISGSAAPANLGMHVEGQRPAPTSVHHDLRNNFSANSLSGLTHAQSVAEKFSDSCATRTSTLPTLLLQLRAKYNVTHPYCSLEKGTPGVSMREQDRVPTKTLWINIPNGSPSCITDDEVLNVCNLAINNVGSVVWLSRSNFPTGSSWFVECSSVETANTLLKNVRECPGTFFQVEFSNSEKHHGPTLSGRPEGSNMGLTSPRISHDGPMVQNAHTFQSTWTGGQMLEVGRTVPSEQSWMYGKHENAIHSGAGGTASIMQNQRPSVAPPQAVPVSTFTRPVYVPPNNMWDARGLAHHLPPNPMPSCVIPGNAHTNLQGPPFLPASVTPLAQLNRSSMVPFDQRFSHPVFPPLSSLPPPPSNVPPPLSQSDFRPPLPPHPGLQPPLPPTPPPLPPPPPPPHSQPPLFPPPPSSPLPPPPHSQHPPPPPPHSQPPPPPHSQPPPPPPPRSQPPPPPPPHSQPLPPPPPHSQPPIFPPPPSSPVPRPPHSQPPMFPPPPRSPLPPHSHPPPPPSVSVSTDGSRLWQQYSWQGILSKSGVHYCTINAQRVDSDICKYSNAIAEPEGWPAKLDMMKRTDLQHVKSTFSSTPPHRREICWLLPSSHGDDKGLQDFITYLKQRECAGVIKIAASRSMWARLLFILPYSPDTCSMLSIPPNPSPCLIALVLPKESNSE